VGESVRRGAVLAVALLAGLGWFWLYPLQPPTALERVLVEAFLLAAILVAYGFMRRLRNGFVDVGLELLSLALFLDFLDEFSGDTDLYNAPVENVLKILGFALVLPGVWLVQRRRQREIEQLRLTTDLLRESEERFRRLAENASDVVFRHRVRPDPGFEYVSPAVENVLGYTPAELYADPELVEKVVDPADMARLVALGDSATLLRAPHLARLYRRDGRVAWIELRLTPVYDRSGAFVAVEGIARDVTESRETDEQLRRAQRLETAVRLASQVAHDFNNLLGPLVAYPELILDVLPDGHPARPLCEQMLRSAEQMASINQNLLALGRRGHVDQRPLDLNRLAVEALEGLLAPPTLTIERRLDPELLPISGSAAQLTRVLANLLTNARDAMADRGTLTVATASVYVDRPVGGYNRVEIGEYARVDVSDSGPGIDPAIRDRIFDAFFTTKQGAGLRGSGLGLSIVQAIVDDHRGYVDVRSEPGRGAVFSVYLPVTRDAIDEKLDESLPVGHERVLVVDDDPMQREVALRLLERLGYTASAAASGEAAVARLRDEQFDLLVLDMVMPPGIDGADTYRRAAELRPGIRAVVVSGFAESDRVRQAQELGAGAYVRKPVTLSQLAHAVRAELDRD
jgi:two-component system cell cycle sensor histidine kinase/response regulator CckA